MNVNAKIVELLTDYLTGRMQHVIFSDEQSQLVTTNQGVLQGTVLGPFLFNIASQNLGIANSNSVNQSYRRCTKNNCVARPHLRNNCLERRSNEVPAENR